MKRGFWMMAAILMLGSASVITSCSKDDNKGPQSGLVRSDYDENRPVGWAEGCSERMPRMRFGRAHVFNCLYTCSDNLYCIGAGYKSNIYAEKNAFINVNSPWMLWATKTDYTDYNITMTDNIGAPDIQERSGNADYFKPTYSYRAYDVLKEQEVVSNRDFGAGATLTLEDF